MSRRRAAAGLVGAVALAAGCGSPSPLGSAALVVLAATPGAPGPSGSYLSTTVVDAAGGCPLSKAAKLSIDGIVMPFVGCSTPTMTFAGNPVFTFQITDGEHSGEAVIGNLVPGVKATLLAPAGGQSPPGGDLQLSVPAALQALTPYVAEFKYEDIDPSSYNGEDTIPTAFDAQGGTVDVPAPQHTGRFEFWLLMNVTFPAAAVAPPADAVMSCTGFASCSASPATVLGPLAIDVVAPPS